MYSLKKLKIQSINVLLIEKCKKIGGCCSDSYGNIFFSDTLNHHIFKIDKNQKISLFSGDYEFNNPTGLCYYNESVYVVNHANHQIHVIKNNQVNHLCGSKNGLAGFKDGMGCNSRLCFPSSIAVNKSGNIYICDSANNAIRRVKNGLVQTISGNIEVGGQQADAENVRANQLIPALRRPKSIVLDKCGILYICDAGNYKIKKITPSGWVHLHSGSGIRANEDYDYISALDQFNCSYAELHSMDIDNNGNLFIIDFNDDYARVVKVNANGNQFIIANIEGKFTDNCPYQIVILDGKPLILMADAV